ncbi:MAG TPA: dCTP deaminase, partial [Saprospiraceae bacterium]|nr:dCTP deaminase [Saprospiraceae bacterium]
MILTDKEILKSIADGNIVIDPYRPDCLGTNSYDVHLGKWLAVYENHELDAKKHNKIKHFEIGPEGFVLLPGTLYLG